MGGGVFISKDISVGLEILSTARRKEIRNISQLQPNSMFAFDLGTKTDLKTSYGFSLNRVKKIKGDLYLDLGIFFHVLKGKSIEKGSIVDQNNISLGIDYEKTKKILYQNSTGLNSSLIFLVNDYFGIRCSILQISVDSEKFNGSELNVVLPSYIGILLKF